MTEFPLTNEIATRELRLPDLNVSAGEQPTASRCSATAGIGTGPGVRNTDRP
jgi:hypothetical protein